MNLWVIFAVTLTISFGWYLGMDLASVILTGGG